MPHPHRVTGLPLLFLLPLATVMHSAPSSDAALAPVETIEEAGRCCCCEQFIARQRAKAPHLLLARAGAGQLPHVARVKPSAGAVPDREAHEAAARTLLTEGGALLHPTLARERVKCNRAHLAPRAVSLGGRRRPAEARATGEGWLRRRWRRHRCRRLPHQLVHAGAFEEAARRKAAAEGGGEGIDRGRRARRRGDALKDAGDVL